MVMQSKKNKWLIHPYAPAIAEGNVTYGYNAKKNRLSSVAGASLTHDNEGQLAIDNSGNTYTFDYEHRLKTIGTDTEFFYDGRGSRLKANRAGVETRYIYDAAGRLLAEVDENNNFTYYIYGNGLLAMVKADNQVYCYHFNGVGSTIAMTSNTQAVVNTYSYDTFGNIAAQQETVAQPFKYVGQFGVMAEPNGFYYMKARYYDPTVGRFISEDPIGFAGGYTNLTAYVGNNPVTGIDPSRLCDQDSVTLPLNALADLSNSALGFAGELTGGRAAKLFDVGKFAFYDKYYSLSFYGNQYIDAASIAAVKAEQTLLATAGRLVQGVSGALGFAFAFNEAYESGFSTRGGAKNGIGSAIAVIGVAGGPVGAGSAVALGVFNYGGGFDSFYNLFDNTPSISK